MKTKIRIYKSDLEFYTEATTTVDASLLTGVHQGNISRAINGKLLMPGGFVFVRVLKSLNRDTVTFQVEEYFSARKMSVSQFVANKFGGEK